MRLRAWALIGIFAALISGSHSRAAEAPQISIDDLYFEPQGKLFEPSSGGAGPILWSVGVKTHFASWIDADVSVGAPDLLYRPAWSSALGSPQAVNLVDGVVTLHASIGDFYAGQFLVPWGLDGQTLEQNLWLPRTLLYEEGAFPLRDVGAGFHTDVDGYYMNLAVHNGEGAELSNADNRMFVTGQWGYKGPANSNIGLGLTTGRVAAPDAFVFAGPDGTVKAVTTTDELIRGANAFFGFNIFGLGLQIEGTYLQEVAGQIEDDVIAWHADLEHPISDYVNFIGRFEQFNPNSSIGDADVLGRVYVGGEYHSGDNTSRLFFYLIKNTEATREVPNDGILVSWRLTPPL